MSFLRLHFKQGFKYTLKKEKKQPTLIWAVQDMLHISFREYVLDRMSTANVSQSSILHDWSSPRSTIFLLVDFTHNSFKK